MVVNLYKIGQWAENQGLVGEKPTFLTGAAALITFKPLGFGIVSASGAGKSATMDLLVGDEHDNRPSLIKSEYFYFRDAGSETAQFRDAAKINTKRGIIIKELQKDKSHSTVEMIKSLTEGKCATRKVTNMTKFNDETGEHGTVDEQVINPKLVAYSLATENDMKPDAELARRCITVNTDVSKTQTENVLRLKAERLWDVKSTQCMTDEESDAILAQVDIIANLNIAILNPFAPVYAIEIGKIAPDQKTRSLMGHFWNVVEGVTKFNYMGHTLRVFADNKLTTLVNIQDMWQTMDIYLNSFVKDIHGIPPNGDIVLLGFRHAGEEAQSGVGKKKSSGNLSSFVPDIDTSASITMNKCREIIKKKQNITLQTKTVRDICYKLIDAGYLEEDKSEKVITYSTTSDTFKNLDKPDPHLMLDEASKLVKEKFPDRFEEWLALQKLPYINPVTGETVVIFPEEVELEENDDLN